MKEVLSRIFFVMPETNIFVLFRNMHSYFNSMQIRKLRNHQTPNPSVCGETTCRRFAQHSQPQNKIQVTY